MQSILEQILDKYQSYIPDSNMLKHTLAPIVTQSQLDFQRKEMQERLREYIIYQCEGGNDYIDRTNISLEIHIKRMHFGSKNEVFEFKKCLEYLKNEYKNMYGGYYSGPEKIHPHEFLRIKIEDEMMEGEDEPEYTEFPDDYYDDYEDEEQLEEIVCILYWNGTHYE